MNKIKTISLISVLLLTTITIGSQTNLTAQTNNDYYDGQLKVYIAEPQSRWDNYDDDPYHFGFLDFAINEKLSINYLDTYTINTTWNAQDAGYKNVKENNIIAIAVVFNPEINEKYANPPSKNPFDAHYVDATAAAKPGETAENFRNETITHTVFCEEATATWCPYCPDAATALNKLYESDKYPFYFVAMIADKSETAYNRLIEDYNLYGYPTCFFDGGYSVVVGASSESTYASKVRTRSIKDVHELDLKIIVEWLGDGILGIEVIIKNNEKMLNSAPLKPTINGPDSGKIKKEIEYTFVTNDPDGDEIYYIIDWGDDSGEVSLGPYKSGQEVNATHIWTEQETYTIRVKARDINDLESDWAELEVSMPKTKLINLNHFVFLDRILQIISNIANLKNL